MGHLHGITIINNYYIIPTEKDGVMSAIKKPNKTSLTKITQKKPEYFLSLATW